MRWPVQSLRRCPSRRQRRRPGLLCLSRSPGVVMQRQVMARWVVKGVRRGLLLRLRTLSWHGSIAMAVAVAVGMRVWVWVC